MLFTPPMNDGCEGCLGCKAADEGATGGDARGDLGAGCTTWGVRRG